MNANHFQRHLIRTRCQIASNGIPSSTVVCASSINLGAGVCIAPSLTGSHDLQL